MSPVGATGAAHRSDRGRALFASFGQQARRLKLGREEYLQRLLTMLIIGEPYPRWNTPNPISRRGLEFLRLVDVLSIGTAPDSGGAAFVDEFDLPRRSDGERGGAPDWAVITQSRLWLIELKTEPASHRLGQLPSYFDLASHHHPGLPVDITYLTPPITAPDPGAGQRFALLTWGQVVTLIREVWAEVDDWSRDAAFVAVEVLEALDTAWTHWRAARIELAASVPVVRPVDRGVELARQVG